MNSAPLHKNQAGQPSSNGGHFAAGTRDDAPEGLLDRPASATERFAAARHTELEAHKAALDLAPDAIRELILEASPAAATATIEFTEDEDTPHLLSLRTVSDAKGNRIVLGSDVSNAVRDIGETFQTSDEVMQSQAFHRYTPLYRGTFTVELTLQPAAGE